MAARRSIDSDAQHLLSDTSSIAALSILTRDGSPISSNTITPRASIDHSSSRRDLAPSSAPTPSINEQSYRDESNPTKPQQRPYRGFPSEEAYLAALREWAEEKQYIQLETTLYGWYGTKTQQEYLEQPGGGTGLSELKAKIKERKQEKKRRRASTMTTTIGGAIHGETNDSTGKRTADRGVATRPDEVEDVAEERHGERTRRMFPWSRRGSNNILERITTR